MSSSTKTFLPASHRAPLSGVESLAAMAGSDDHGAQSAPLRPNIQMMSSMSFMSLIHWLQRSGIVVNGTENARTMLTATDMLPVESNKIERSGAVHSEVQGLQVQGQINKPVQHRQQQQQASVMRPDWGSPPNVNRPDLVRVNATMQPIRNTALESYQRQLMRLEQQRAASSKARSHAPPLQTNPKTTPSRSTMAPYWGLQAQTDGSDRIGVGADTQPNYDTALVDYQNQLMLLEQQRKAIETQEAGSRAFSHGSLFPVDPEATPSRNTSHSSTARKRYYSEVAEPVARLDAERPIIDYAHSFPTPPTDAPNARVEVLSGSLENPGSQKLSNNLERVSQQMQAPRRGLSSNMQRIEQQHQQQSSQAQAMATQPPPQMQTINAKAQMQHNGVKTPQNMPMLHHINTTKRPWADASENLQASQNPHSAQSELLPVTSSSSRSDHAVAPVPPSLGPPSIGHGPSQLFGGIMASGPSSYPGPLTKTPAVPDSQVAHLSCNRWTATLMLI